MEFYTYVWRDATNTPFYVGKGKGRRAHNTTHRSQEFKDIYARGGCTVEIVDWFIHESQAHAHEVELIDLYGRRDFGGLLVNKTEGGEGSAGLSECGRAKLSSAMKLALNSPSVRAKMSASAKRRVVTQGGPESVANLFKGRKHSDYSRSKMSGALSGRNLSADHRVKISIARRLKLGLNKPGAGHIGVSFHKTKQKYGAYITTEGKYRYLGYYATPEEAARAYDAAAIAAWGAGNCYLNFPAEHSQAA